MAIIFLLVDVVNIVSKNFFQNKNEQKTKIPVNFIFYNRIHELARTTN